jgi:CRISPR/Cas system endoribonuclease Cas6 (RAMP superfamily)
VDRETVEASLIEKPAFDVCNTHSVVVNRATRENGETKPIKMQGFTGACEYQFKNESPAVRNAITALALFAEYSGVGSAVARGCGTVRTDIQ